MNQFSYCDTLDFRQRTPRRPTGIAPPSRPMGGQPGVRTIPLTSVACSALARLRERAESFGTVELAHYVFAAFVPKFTFSGKKVVDYNVTGFDPTRRVNRWRLAWRTLTKKAGLPGFRFHDLRHCVITSLAESRAADSTIMAIAGHVTGLSFVDSGRALRRQNCRVRRRGAGRR